MNTPATASPSVVILACTGSVEMSITIARDLFCAASQVAQRQQLATPSVRVVSQDGAAITTFSGSRFVPDAGIDAVASADLVIVSGVWTDIDSFLSDHQPVCEWLRQLYAQGAYIASMHSGAYLLAQAGLLDDKVATVYWQSEADFRRRFPTVQVQAERKITSAERIFCSAGIGSGLEMAVYLVERVYGPAVARRVSESFLMDVQREYGEYQLAFDAFKQHDDSAVLAAQNWLEAQHRADFLMDEVAQRTGLSLRSFMRRFKRATGITPLVYLQRVRVEVAKQLLRGNQLSVDQVSLRVGYEDVGFFSRIFRRQEGMTPGEFRQQVRDAARPD